MIVLKQVMAAARVMVVLTMAGTTVGLSQDGGGADPAYPYASETKQERAERLEQARARAREYIARAKAGSLTVPDPERVAKERAELASESAVGDSSLQPGDIVSTTKGLFVFRGSSDRDRRSEDFVPLLEDVRRQPRFRQ